MKAHAEIQFSLKFKWINLVASSELKGISETCNIDIKYDCIMNQRFNGDVLVPLAQPYSNYQTH